MAIKNFPCKNCKHRAMNCHSYCDDYNRAKVDYEKEKEFERCMNGINDYVIKSNIRLANIYKKNNFRRNSIND